MKKTVEKKVITTINGKTLRDRVRSEDLKQQHNIDDIPKWLRKR